MKTKLIKKAIINQKRLRISRTRFFCYSITIFQFFCVRKIQ